MFPNQKFRGVHYSKWINLFEVSDTYATAALPATNTFNLI